MRSTDQARVLVATDREGLEDLLDRALRACVSLNDEGEPLALPAAFHRRADLYWVGGVPWTHDELLAEGTRVTVVIDEGAYWFELRGISISGALSSKGAPPPNECPELRWLELRAERVTAWDFGSIHEVERGPA